MAEDPGSTPTPTGEMIWLRNVTSDAHGRLEREVMGSTPFADVPKSPYYSPSPGWWASARAWMDSDGRHVVVAHDCLATREAHLLPWPTWQNVDGALDPSYSCEACGLHARPGIVWECTNIAVDPGPLGGAARRLYEALAVAWRIERVSETDALDFYRRGFPDDERKALLAVLPPTEVDWIEGSS